MRTSVRMHNRRLSTGRKTTVVRHSRGLAHQQMSKAEVQNLTQKSPTKQDYVAQLTEYYKNNPDAWKRDQKKIALMTKR